MRDRRITTVGELLDHYGIKLDDVVEKWETSGVLLRGSRFHVKFSVTLKDREVIKSLRKENIVRLVEAQAKRYRAEISRCERLVGAGDEQSLG